MRLSLRIGFVALAVCVAALVLAGVLGALPVAQAEADYALVIYDGAIRCAEGDIDNAYYYHKSADNRYTFTYHEGIDLRLGVQTATGESIAWKGAGGLSIVDETTVWQPSLAMRSVARNADGEVTDYVVTGQIGNVNYTFYVRILPRTLSVLEWQNVESEYGMPVNPTVVLSQNIDEVPTFWVEETKIVNGVSTKVYDKAFDANYIASLSGIAYGTYRIKAVLPADSNYVLPSDAIGTYTVSRASATIAVANTQCTITYDGTQHNVMDLLGVSVPEGYGVLCKYKVAGDSTETTNSLLTAAKTYAVWFVFDGDSRNYLHYRTPAEGETYTVTIERADVLFASAGDIEVNYKRDRQAYEFDTIVYNSLGTAYTLTDANGNAAQCTADDFDIRYRLQEGGEFGRTVPDTVGTFWVRVAFNAVTDLGANYNPAEEALVLPLVVNKGEIAVYWYDYAKELAYGQSFDLSDKYYVNNVAFNQWVAEGNEAQYVLSYEYSADGTTWQPYAGGGETPAPGRYRASVTMDSALYCGSTPVMAYWVVNKVAITQEDVRCNGAFTYGDVISPEPVTPNVSLSDGAVWRISYMQEGAIVLPKDNGTLDAGVYDLHLVLEGDDMFACDLVLAGGLTVAKRTVNMWVWNYYVTYGDRVSLISAKYGPDGGDNLVYWQNDAVLAEDRSAFLASISVHFTSPSGAQTSQIDSSFTCKDEGYDMAVVVNSANYDVVYVNDARLYVEKRILRVSFVATGGTFVLYEGTTPRININIDNYVLDSEYEQLLRCFSLRYEDESGNAIEGVPTEVGVYSIKLVYGDEPALANYRVSTASQKLTIKSTALATTLAEFGVSGRFDGGELSVSKGSATRYNSAASAVLAGYHVEVAYEIANVMNASGQITFRLLAPKGLRDAKILYLDGDRWKIVDYSQVGGYYEFVQPYMAPTYLICAKSEINWLMIGLVVGAVVLVAVVLVLVLVLRRVKRNKRIAADAGKQVAAPTAQATQKPDEEEELDSFIDTFDESTVERELTPAERIALREKEEKYRQYKARLQRMRTSDRTLTDTLRGLGLDSGADEDEIIRRMIEADEERARQVEDELRREQEEAKAKEEEERKTIILERSDEVLEQKTFAPTFADTDEDDDIDI